MIIQDAHPYLLLSQQLQDFTQPLELLNVTHFSYIKNYHDGLQIYLSSSPQWVKDYYSQELYLSSAFEAHPKLYNQSYVLWSTHTSDAKVLAYGREAFNTDNGITLVNQIPEGCEFYFFSGPSDMVHNQNNFVNNLHGLHHFVLFFKEHFSKAINNLASQECAIRKQYNAASNLGDRISNQNDETLLQQFFKQTKIRRLYLQLPNIEPLLLSPQQTNCIRSLLQLKKAPEIALDLTLPNVL